MLTKQFLINRTLVYYLPNNLIFIHFSGELGAGTAVGEILDMLDLFSDESDDEW